jgi:hypothetical protein
MTLFFYLRKDEKVTQSIFCTVEVIREIVFSSMHLLFCFLFTYENWIERVSELVSIDLEIKTAKGLEVTKELGNKATVIVYLPTL